MMLNVPYDMSFSHTAGCLLFHRCTELLWLIYIAGDGLGLGFLSYAEIGSRDLSPSLCNVNMFCIVQCSSSKSVPESDSANVNKLLLMERDVQWLELHVVMLFVAGSRIRTTEQCR